MATRVFLLFVIVSNVLSMEYETNEDGLERKEKTVYTYSKATPFIQRYTSSGTSNDESFTSNVELGHSFLRHDYSFGTSISPVSGTHAAELGVSLELQASSEQDIIAFNESFENGENLDNIQPLYTSTPKKTFFAHTSGTDSFIHSNSSVYSDISLSAMETNELGFTIATPIPRSIRNQAERSSTRLLQRFTTIESIKKSLESTCCKINCIQDFSIHEIQELRSNFWSLSIRYQNKFIMEKLRSGNRHIRRFHFYENGKEICPEALKKIYKINKNRFGQLTSNLLEGRIGNTFAVHKGRSNKYLEAMSWLETYAYYHADRMPDSSVQMLPYKTRKIVIFKQYCEESRTNDRLKRAAFYRMWKEDFKNLKIKKVNSFSKCTKCTSIERQMEKTTHPKKIAKLKLAATEHNHRQMMERQYYYKKRNAAKRLPTEILSLIIDGMDQSKSNLPHFVGRMVKAVNPGDQLHTHITGIIAHGQQRFFTYLDIGQYAHDSNLTMNILLLALKRLSELLGGKLPPKLYLQADNCWRENKNKFVLAFCELLVSERIFNEVHLSFLMVGHTHEDIDSGFSRISEMLRRNDAETLTDLLDLLPSVTNIDVLYDIKSWLLPYISDLRKHTKPLHYKFTRNSNKIVVSYKGRHDSKWKDIDGGVLKKTNEGEVHKILGRPKICNINFDNIGLEKIEQRLNNWKCLFSDQEQNTQFEWWNKFLKHWKDMSSSPAKTKTNIYSKGVWLLPKLPKQASSDVSIEEEESNIPQIIQVMLDEEVAEPEITTKKKQAPKEQPSKAKSKPNSRKNGRKQNGAKDKYSTGPTNKTKYKNKRPKRQAVSKFMTIPLTDETKRHLWIMLFMNLLISLIVLYMCILYSMCTLWALRVTLESAWAHIITEHCALMNALAHSLGTFGIELIVQKLYQPHRSCIPLSSQ